MNSFNTLISLFSFLPTVFSCSYILDKYCCNGVEFVNDCFVQSAGNDPTLCQHNQCIQEIVSDSTEWTEVNQYATSLDSTINAKLLDSGVRLNYGCSDHQRLKGAIKIQLDKSKNYYIKLQLLCDPLGNYAHIFFNVPYIDDDGHVLMPHPEYIAMEYPHTETDVLNTFIDENIIIPTDTPVVGNDADENGCIASAGYSWCDIKQKCLRPWEETCVTTSAPELGVIGGDKDENGCIISAGYSWCDIKQKCLRPWEETCVITAAPVIGGDKDENGCISSAGYTWCDTKQKCLRVWEEDCVSTTTAPELGVIGGDKDENGCISSAGYTWCDFKQKCLRVWEEDCVSTTASETGVIGGNQDEHNCYTSGGYTWCESKGKCLRIWEEDCSDSATTQVIVDEVGNGEEDGFGYMKLMRLGRVGIIGVVVILGILIGIVVCCVVRKRNKVENRNVQSNEASISYENLL